MGDIHELNLDGSQQPGSSSVPEIDIALRNMMHDTKALAEILKFPEAVSVMSDLLMRPVSRIENVRAENMLEFVVNGKGPDVTPRGVRFDVYFETGKTMVDVELQVRNEPNLLARIRYYQSALTMSGALEKRQPYGMIRPTIVVFLCSRPPFPDMPNCPLFRVQNVVQPLSVNEQYSTRYAQDGATSLIYSALACHDVPYEQARKFLLMFQGDTTECDNFPLYRRIKEGSSMNKYFPNIPGVANPILYTQEELDEERAKALANGRLRTLYGVFRNLYSQLNRNDMCATLGIDSKEYAQFCRQAKLPERP